MGVYNVSKRYGIPERTLRYHREKGTDAEEFTGGKRSSLGSGLEKALGSWVDEMVDRGFAVDRMMINQKARFLNPSLRCSNRWFYVISSNFFSYPRATSKLPSGSRD